MKIHSTSENMSKLSKKYIIAMKLISTLYLSIIMISSIFSIFYLKNNIDIKLVFILFFSVTVVILTYTNAIELNEFVEKTKDELIVSRRLIYLFATGILLNIAGMYMFVLEICNIEDGIASPIILIGIYTIYRRMTNYSKKLSLA